ncbi:sulfurtransferase complex subunit TusB [Pseudomonas sp. PS1]|uniref:Sulfurtransferase complex subunit TusB n=1 Tax=Stutzerimonas marianensis TaxID=2929513 RepID=A0A9X1W0Q7_9GAMM|nr:sulfurtransferase complex subunit TusB [Pseudomonas marianensis]MCJ0972911.1 sulfurtransferase complex subunit TusB [Pseudomonas marianensis]
MSTLHLLSHSPFGDNRLDSCLRLIAAGDGLLLSGDAVYALQAGTAPRAAVERLPEAVSVFALEEDLTARGLEGLPERLESIAYARFVELCCLYERTNAWL